MMSNVYIYLTFFDVNSYIENFEKQNVLCYFKQNILSYILEMKKYISTKNIFPSYCINLKLNYIESLTSLFLVDGIIRILKNKTEIIFFEHSVSSL